MNITKKIHESFPFKPELFTYFVTCYRILRSVASVPITDVPLYFIP